MEGVGGARWPGFSLTTVFKLTVFSLLPHRQEGPFGCTLLKAQNDFQLRVPCLLTVSLK